MDESGTEALELLHKIEDSGTIHEWEMCYI